MTSLWRIGDDEFGALGRMGRGVEDVELASGGASEDLVDLGMPCDGDERVARGDRNGLLRNERGRGHNVERALSISGKKGARVGREDNVRFGVVRS